MKKYKLKAYSIVNEPLLLHCGYKHSTPGCYVKKIPNCIKYGYPLEVYIDGKHIMWNYSQHTENEVNIHPYIQDLINCGLVEGEIFETHYINIKELL